MASILHTPSATGSPTIQGTLWQWHFGSVGGSIKPWDHGRPLGSDSTVHQWTAHWCVPEQGPRRGHTAMLSMDLGNMLWVLAWLFSFPYSNRVPGKGNLRGQQKSRCGSHSHKGCIRDSTLRVASRPQPENSGCEVDNCLAMQKQMQHGSLPSYVGFRIEKLASCPITIAKRFPSPQCKH